MVDQIWFESASICLFLSLLYHLCLFPLIELLSTRGCLLKLLISKPCSLSDWLPDCLLDFDLHFLGLEALAGAFVVGELLVEGAIWGGTRLLLLAAFVGVLARWPKSVG